MTERNTTCIINGKIVLSDEILLDHILIFNEKILKIAHKKQLEKYLFASNMKVIDAGGKYVSPGFIDVHIHGAGGCDTMDATPSGLYTIAQMIARNGVTSFLPTTLSAGFGQITQSLEAIRIAMKGAVKGAAILGAHMEGPFINPSRKGAHKEESLTNPDYALVEKYNDIIKIITIAPEEDVGFKFIKNVKQNSNIVLSMGHTNADYETAMAAIDAGVSSATHFFNAMSPLHHRAPGVVGAVLNSDVMFELIADTLHVHPALFQLLLRVKGRDKIVLVTDSMRASGMKPGQWELGGQKVFVDDVSARLQDGTLAGSVLKMNQAVYNLLCYTDMELYEAVAAASLNPATLIDIQENKGSIKEGKDADLIIFDDTVNIECSICKGKIIHEISGGIKS